ncbi:hypothetical protein LCGC14_1388260 [marine sediment metagenome]|uniref:Uncharacterized protein n=1 Tax=marine sediment metagenome TaxID=412755 RepID=A0A0F9KLH7_9ZZZZ
MKQQLKDNSFEQEQYDKDKFDELDCELRSLLKKIGVDLNAKKTS